MQISQFYSKQKHLFWGIILSILLPGALLKGQSSEASQLEESVDTRLTAIIDQGDPQVQFPLLLGLSAAHSKRMNPFTVQFIQRSLEQVQPGDSIIPAATHFLIGEFLNVNLQRFSAALQYFRSALELLPASSPYKPELRMRIQDRIAYLSLSVPDLETAITAADECRALADTLGHRFTHGHCLKCLGNIQGDYFNKPDLYARYSQEALGEFERSFQTNVENRDTLAILLNLFYISSIKLEMETGFEDGNEYLETASSFITSDETYDDFRAQITYQKARFLAKNNDYDAAIDTFRKAYRQFLVTKDTARLVQTRYLMAELLFRQGKTAETVEQLNQALELAPKVASSGQIKAIQDLRYQSYKALGDTASALQAHEAFFRASQTVNQEDQQRYILGFEAQNKLQAKQREILQGQAALAKKSKDNRNLTLGISLLAVLLTLLLISFIRARNHRNELRDRNAIIIRQKQQLEELDDLKSRFFANVSHELKTPLALIKAPLEHLSRKFPVGQGGDFFLNTALNNTQRLERLVNELLDLSKIESGKTTIENKPYEIKLLCRQIIESFHPLALSQKVTLDWAGKEKDPLLVLTEQEAFQKILTNLLSNAVKFSPAGERVVIDFSLLDGEAVLSVQDSGPGIYDDDLPHIFDRFHQSTHQDVHRKNSTGIGLALSAELARLMNGRLRVESERGKGSTFFLHLPLAKGAGEVTNAQPGSPPREETDIFREMESLKEEEFHILIVEDHEELRAYLSRLLKDYFQIHTASNGREALELISAKDTPLARPGRSLIISDLMMPEMDGVQLMEQLKGDQRYQHIPMIMLTAHRDRSRRIEAFTFGVDDYLVKPFDNQELLIRIKNLVLRNLEKTKAETPLGNARHDENKPEGIGQPQAPLDSEQLDWLMELQAFAIKHLSDSQFSVSFLSHHANMSHRNFQRHIKKITGMTPSEYIKEIRLHQARELLESRQVNSVKAVSRAVGFSSHEYFSNQFYNRFGRRPSTYLGR